MNLFAYRTTGLAIKTISNISKAVLNLHDEQKIPIGSAIFVINHFTRLETFLLPYILYNLTKVPVWSLADFSLFKGLFGDYLERIGAVSTRDPDRDRLIVRSLMTGEASWIIYPEGWMVKSKKIFEKGRFVVASPEGVRPPHSGAATLAIRTEFYRRRIRALAETNPEEARRLMDMFNVADLESIGAGKTAVVPVNITYYPVRAKENMLNQLAKWMVEDIPERVVEEIMIEGTMLLSGVDMDIRFGDPIPVDGYLDHPAIEKDIISEIPYDFDDPIPSIQQMRKSAKQLMINYMAAIYDLTTINHDHLFSAVLNCLFFDKTTEDRMKRKVFWIATHLSADARHRLHKDLLEDQVHLLTDDRQDKFSEFVQLAEKTNALQKNGRILVRNTAVVPSKFDFHQVRVDNPISVMANEIEPLKDVQKQVRRAAWIPDFWMKRRVVSYLLKQDIAQFEADYAAHCIQDESKPKEVGMPFLVKGSAKRIGVLLIHGYMAAPMEVAGLASYLGRQGFWVYVPRLKGHGTSPEDLAMRSFKDWIRSADTGYAVIRNICRKVIVGGFSTGAGIALELASRVDGVSGVFAVAPPMRLQDLSAKLAPAVGVWNRILHMINLDEVAMEFVENRPENPHINYTRNPISGVREIERLMEYMEPRLGDIKIPSIVVQADNDPVVSQKGAIKIYERLGSPDKRYVVFNSNRHGILLGDGADRVYRLIADFIRGLRENEKRMR